MKKFISNILITGLLLLASAGVAAAQTETDLKTYFEGKHVAVKLDMPATKEGVNVYPERDRAVDYERYGNLLKSYGASLLEGDRILITKIKVKDKSIEFQLGGGGYGTFGDESASSGYVPTASKTNREKDLEKRLKYEQDDRARRRIREEIDYLRSEREREDNANRAAAAAAEEVSKARIQEKRLQGGARFNIKFDRKVSAHDLTPEAIMSALSQYLDFADFSNYSEQQ